jgi:NAD(P)-dependent dehydrogenase (short-subunit alcohol dehydrogenase family)
LDLQLAGKLALITGGSAGIGLSVARGLLAEGCRVAIVGRDAARLAQAAAACGTDRLTTIAADLSRPEGAPTAMEQVLRTGVPDILVNCAGAAQGGLFWDLSDEVWTDALALKFMGAIRMMRAVVPLMVQRGSGHVVNVVGNNGRQPAARLLPGSAANAALLAVTKGLADEVAGAGVVINAVNPGPTRTGRWQGIMERQAAASGRSVAEVEKDHVSQIPSGRLNEPDEIARYIIFLCSPAASAAIGTSITIDGGATRALA